VAEATQAKLGNLILEQSLLDANHEKQVVSVVERNHDSWMECVLTTSATHAKLVLCIHLCNSSDKITLNIDEMHKKSVSGLPTLRNSQGALDTSRLTFAGTELPIESTMHGYAWKSNDLNFQLVWDAQNEFSLAKVRLTSESDSPNRCIQRL